MALSPCSTVCSCIFSYLSACVCIYKYTSTPQHTCTDVCDPGVQGLCINIYIYTYIWFRFAVRQPPPDLPQWYGSPGPGPWIQILVLFEAIQSSSFQFARYLHHFRAQTRQVARCMHHCEAPTSLHIIFIARDNIHISIYIYIHTYAHTHTHIYIYICNGCMYVCMYACMHACMYVKDIYIYFIFVNLHTYIFIYVNIFTYIYIYIYIYIDRYADMCVVSAWFSCIQLLLRVVTRCCKQLENKSFTSIQT